MRRKIEAFQGFVKTSFFFLDFLFSSLSLPPAARGPHGMGNQLGPSGLSKTSLNEPKRRQMQQSIVCKVIGKMLPAHRVSKSSNFLTSYLLNFYLFPLDPPKKLLIKPTDYTDFFKFFISVTSVSSVAKKR